MKAKIPRSITILSTNTVVVCFEEAKTNGIMSYNLQTGAELSCVNLLPDAHGLAEVNLGGKLALAVARRFVKILNFEFTLNLMQGKIKSNHGR